MPLASAVRRAPAALAPALALALALALAACDSPTAAEPAAPAAGPVAVAADKSGPSAPPVSTVEALPGGVYRFTSTAVLDVPEGAAWAKIHDIETIVGIALPGVASDFRWLDGGGPSKVPSRFTFNALGASILEEVFFVDKHAKVLKYRLVVPALGLQTYAGTIDLDPVDNTHTRITFSRDATFDDPAAVPGFAQLFHDEAAAIQAYFND